MDPRVSPGATPPKRSTVVAVVGLVLGSAIVAVAYELWTGPAPAGVVEIRTAVWTTACAPSQPAGCLAPPVSQLDGTCLDLAGSFPVGSQVRCNIVSHIPAYVSGVGVA